MEKGKIHVVLTYEKAMNSRRNIAIILNALVLPGVGHIYLGQRLKGTLLSLLCVFFIVAPIVKYGVMTSYVLNLMPPRDEPAALNLAYALANTWPQMRNIMLLSLGGLAIIWIYGIVDVYLVCRHRERSETIQ